MDNEYTAWPENFPETTCLVPYAELRHSTDPEIRELYDRAKNHEDKEAAAELINRLVTNEGVEKTIDKIKQIAAKHPHAIITHVHAIDRKGRNAIPQALAEFVGAYSNLEVDNSIVQTNIVSKTGVKSAWYRFAHRAAFEGAVKAGREYILVDDVVSAGGTFSELRQFIERHGGKLVDTITMANGAKSLDARLAVTPAHILELENKYGVELLRRFLQEEDLYGGNHKALTDAEARTILGAASLNEAGDRIAEARQERRFDVFPEVVPGTPPDTEAIADSQKYSERLQKSLTEINNVPLDDTGHIENASSALTLAILKLEEDPAFIRTPDFLKLTNEAYIALHNLPFDDAGHIENALSILKEQTVSYTEKSNSLKERYAGALSRYGIKSDEAQQAYREYKDYEMLKRFDPAGVRKGRYDADDGEAERMINAIHTRLDAENEQRKRLTPASYGAENKIYEEKTMSDEFEQALSQSVEPEMDALDPDREPMTAEEQAFRTVLHQRSQIAESLKNGSLPCLPGADGCADTTPAVNLTTGTRYHGANLLYLKDFQKRNGFPTAEYATLEAVRLSGVPIRKGEHGISITFDQKTGPDQWEKKNVRLFNVAQLSRPWEFKKYAENLAEQKEQEKQEYLKSQYGDKYQPPEKKEPKPGPEITCSSTEPDRYLAQYFAAVSLGSTFNVSPQQAGEFTEKLQAQLNEQDWVKQSTNGVEEKFTNPFKLSKICNAASVQCKEIIKDVTQPRREQEQTQKQEQTHSRRL
jgi:adenine/guanine phosphoribosyltransferase-like PRPP-binding protein